MKLAIIGSRTLTDYDWFKEQVCGHFFHQQSDGDGGLSEWWDFNEVISGGAVGADQFSARLVKEWNRLAGYEEIKLTEHLPDWERYGKRAGFIRNELIVKDADMVLAFWDGLSKGTANSLSIAKRLKKTTLIVYF